MKKYFDIISILRFWYALYMLGVILHVAGVFKLDLDQDCVLEDAKEFGMEDEAAKVLLSIPEGTTDDWDFISRRYKH